MVSLVGGDFYGVLCREVISMVSFIQSVLQQTFLCVAVVYPQCGLIRSDCSTDDSASLVMGTV